MRHRNIIIGRRSCCCAPSPRCSPPARSCPARLAPANADDPVVLTVTGNGQTKTFTLAELEALPAYTGWSGYEEQRRDHHAAGPVKGVKLSRCC